jgi:cytochrome c-type biogenesis protein CcmH/NrfG
LLFAVAFAVLLNAALWVTLVVPQLVAGHWCLLGWVLVSGLWILGLWQAIRWPAYPPGGGDHADRADCEDRQDLFIRAQHQYLKGHWTEASSLLEQQLRRNPGDIEARLLVASVLRRTGRPDLARLQLGQIERFEGAEKWRFEIRREWGLLDRVAVHSP